MSALAPNTGLALSAITLRKLIGWLGVALPAVCAFYSIGSSLEILPSISAYYYTRVHALFVGILCVLGASLFSYRGYTAVEDGLAKIGGLCAVGVALCPTAPELVSAQPVVDQLIGPAASAFAVLHGIFACSMFLIFMIFSAVFFTRTHESDLKDPLSISRAAQIVAITLFTLRSADLFILEVTSAKQKRNKVYRLCARFIGFSVLAVLVVALLRGVQVIDHDPFNQFIFSCEVVALWAFAASWLTKAEQFSFLRDEPAPNLGI